MESGRLAKDRRRHRQFALYLANRAERPFLNATNQLRLATDAALFDLGAGEIHGAIGGEYYVEHVTRDASGSNTTGSSGTGSTFSHQKLHRNVGSAFAELQVPLVSADMNIPLVQKLSIDARRPL